MRYLLVVFPDDAKIGFGEDVGLEFDGDFSKDAAHRITAALDMLTGPVVVGEIFAEFESVRGNKVSAGFGCQINLEFEDE